MKHKLLPAFFLAFFLPTGAALAQDAPNAPVGLDILVLISTLLYGVIGILLLLVGYFIFDRIVGLDLKRELVEDQNTALGIMLAGVFIGTAIVIAAVMLS